MRRRHAGRRKAWHLFGPERTGLDNDDVALASAILTFPVNPAYGSLNLAQAVLLCGYEYFLAREGGALPFAREKRSPPAQREMVLSFFEFIESKLDAAGFFRPKSKRPVMQRNLRNLFHRMDLTQQDVRTLWGAIVRLVEGPREKPQTRKRIKQKKPQDTSVSVSSPRLPGEGKADGQGISSKVALRHLRASFSLLNATRLRRRACRSQASMGSRRTSRLDPSGPRRRARRATGERWLRLFRAATRRKTRPPKGRAQRTFEWRRAVRRLDRPLFRRPRRDGDRRRSRRRSRRMFRPPTCCNKMFSGRRSPPTLWRARPSPPTSRRSQNEAATVQQIGTALAEIENSLNAALAEAKQTAFAADLQNLLQAVEAGASEEAAALAEKLQAARQGAGALNPAAISASLPQAQAAAALPALVKNLIATTQSGDMTAAAFFAQAIRMQMDEAPAAAPPGWLAALAAARPARSWRRRRPMSPPTRCCKPIRRACSSA